MKHVVLALLLLAPTATAQTNLRAWAADGQTWLVWEDDAGLTDAETYAVYRAATPVSDVSTATLVGRLFPRDWSAHRLAISAGVGATFTVPDGAGGTYTLAPNEAVFAYTSHGAGPEHFAVVAFGETVPPAGATAGPVTPSGDPVVPHAQFSGLDGAFPFTTYALWVDGHADPESGSAGFPVMGNEHFNGVAHVFAVFEPAAGLPADPAPAVVFLHGGDGSYWTYRPTKSATVGIDLEPVSWLYVTLDDSHVVYWDQAAPTVNPSLNSRWFGFQSGFDRFESPFLPAPDDAVVLDHTQRRMDFVLDWLVADQNVDADRIAMAGLSNGGRGTLNYTRARPDRISAATVFVPPVEPTEAPATAMYGAFAQELPTNLPSGVPYVEFLDPVTLTGPEDLPFTRIVWGTTDSKVPWGPVPDTIAAIDAQARGAALCWDDRGHTAGAGLWTGAHFVGSPRFDAQWLTRYRASESYPAFSDVDHDPLAVGVQPFPTAPPSDPHGTHGGWLDWNVDSVVDTATQWSASIGVVGSSTFAGDIAPLPTATASVTVRRAQAFTLAAHQTFEWELVEPGPVIVASGLAIADATGHARVDDLQLDTTPARLVLRPLGSTWEPVGGGVVGVAGPPELEALGALDSGSPLTVDLSSARPLAPALLVVGASSVDLPLFGGTLVPAPLAWIGTFTDIDGNATWGATLGVVPVGSFELVLQAWIVDPAAALGFAATDGLVGTAF